MAKSEFWTETSRDFIALGSLIFFLLAIARAFIGPYWTFFYQLATALAILFLLSIYVKEYDAYLARGLALAFFISLFYMNNNFTTFVVLVYIGIIASSHYLGSKIPEILKGILLGIISIVSSYYLTQLLI